MNEVPTEPNHLHVLNQEINERRDKKNMPVIGHCPLRTYPLAHLASSYGPFFQGTRAGGANPFMSKQFIVIDVFPSQRGYLMYDV